MLCECDSSQTASDWLWPVTFIQKKRVQELHFSFSCGMVVAQLFDSAG